MSTLTFKRVDDYEFPCVHAYTLYRVEDKKGRGPYIEPLEKWAVKDHNKSPNTPALWEDSVFGDEVFHKFVPGYAFGFATLTDLFHWFDAEEIATLDERGFTVKKYTCSKVIFARNQLIFDKECATLIQ